MPRIDSFLRLVVEQNASDLHFCAGSSPVIRYNGDLVHIKFRKLGASETKRFLFEILDDAQRREVVERGDLDFAYDIPGTGRFRVNIFQQADGLGAAFRVIPGTPPTLSEMKLPRSLRRFTELESGLVLVTGPTGCGKSTTLAAIVNELNREQRKHILTIEDPIEFVYDSVKSVVSQREVGRDVDSFAAALRASFRESPDVILVGELRDNETIGLAMTLAATGTLVFGTLHTSSASKSIDRILDSYPEEQQDQIRGMLSMSLRGVISQKLCKTVGGFSRVAAVEILTWTYAISNLIREGKTYQIYSLMQTADTRKTGMETLDQALIRLMERGRITPEEARLQAYDRTLFEKYVG
jgi:twitching motility protein PilT